MFIIHFSFLFLLINVFNLEKKIKIVDIIKNQQSSLTFFIT